MNKRQKFVVVLVFLMSMIVGTCTAAHAESIYIPYMANFYIKIEVKHSICSVGIPDLNALIDVPGDGKGLLVITTDEDGIARWEGAIYSPFIYIYEMKNGGRLLFNAQSSTYTFDYCGDEIVIVPPPQLSE